MPSKSPNWAFPAVMAAAVLLLKMVEMDGVGGGPNMGEFVDYLTHPSWDFDIFFRIGSWIKLMESTKTGVSKIMASWSFMIIHFFMFEFSFACFSTFYQQLSTNYMTF